MKLAKLGFTALAVTLALMAPPSYSSDKFDDICTAGGYFSGAEQRFLTGLTQYYLFNKGAYTESKCSALWAYAYDVGAYLSRNAKIRNKNDEEILRKAMTFRDKVYDAVLKNMRLP